MRVGEVQGGVARLAQKGLVCAQQGCVGAAEVSRVQCTRCVRAGRVCGGGGRRRSVQRRKGERIAAQIPAKGADATQSVAALVAFDPTLPAA